MSLNRQFRFPNGSIYNIWRDHRNDPNEIQTHQSLYYQNASKNCWAQSFIDQPRVIIAGVEDKPISQGGPIHVITFTDGKITKASTSYSVTYADVVYEHRESVKIPQDALNLIQSGCEEHCQHFNRWGDLQHILDAKNALPDWGNLAILETRDDFQRALTGSSDNTSSAWPDFCCLL